MVDAVVTHGNLSDLLPWRNLVAEDPVVLTTKTGRLQTALRYQCPDTEHMHPDVRSQYFGHLHTVLGHLDADWHLEADWWHETAPGYPDATWDTKAGWLIDEVRRLDFTNEPRHVSESYLTLSWQPPKAMRRWLRTVLLARATERVMRQTLDEQIALFQGGVERFCGLLEALWQLERLDADGVCTYLHQSIAWERFPVRCPDVPTSLDRQLSNATWVPSQPPYLAGMLVQPITIQSWQRRLGLWLPEALAHLPFPCRYVVRMKPMSTQEADTWLRWEEKKWAGSKDRLTGFLKKAGGQQAKEGVQRRDVNTKARDVAESLLDVQEAVLAGRDVLGRLSGTVLCWAPDMRTLEQRVLAIKSVLFREGLIARQEEGGASIEHLATIPGNTHLGQRWWTTRTRELSGLIPHSTIWMGERWNRHLDGPSLLVATTGAAPFWMSTHYGALGWTLIQGPSRSGKSGLVGLRTSQWLRYPRARQALFDQAYALKCATLMHGGVHVDLAEDRLGLQPLGWVDTLADRQAAMVWLEGVFAGEGLTTTPSDRQEMLEALGQLATLPRRQRTLSLYRTLLQVGHLKKGLAAFCKGDGQHPDGLYSFFDAHEDAFHLNTRIICFEMQHLMDMPRAIGPFFGHVLRRLEAEWFTGDPVHLTIEEARWMLDMAPFLGKFELYLKARAKINVGGTVVCQEAYDLARTDAWQGIQSNIPLKIMLPNPSVMQTDVKPFYTGMGCDESDLLRIQQGQNYRDYLFKSPHGTRQFQLHLRPVERLLCAASTPDELAVLATMQASVDPGDLPSVWLRHWGYNEEATLLERLGKDHHGNEDADHRFPPAVALTRRLGALAADAGAGADPEYAALAAAAVGGDTAGS